MLFNTSGTTGFPKLIIHTRKQFDSIARMSTQALGWNSSTRYLNFAPAFTAGFWLIVIPALVKHGAELLLGSRETAVQDTQYPDRKSTRLNSSHT